MMSGPILLNARKIIGNLLKTQAMRDLDRYISGLPSSMMSAFAISI